ncbi:hypothetical protein Taro_003496 [Colocasia esculenta]|uniref:DUF4283 domain-containing protein n=1 Tax=Colocasia esculenta TaxID=4460 RepID=A0A843TH91_COLES|nr:hypothetical protein [Colocasia esculenta]
MVSRADSCTQFREVAKTLLMASMAVTARLLLLVVRGGLTEFSASSGSAPGDVSISGGEHGAAGKTPEFYAGSRRRSMGNRVPRSRPPSPQKAPNQRACRICPSRRPPRPPSPPPSLFPPPPLLSPPPPPPSLPPPPGSSEKQRKQSLDPPKLGSSPAAASIPKGVWGAADGTTPTFAQVLLKSIQPPVISVPVHPPATTDAGEHAVFFSYEEVKLSCKALDLAVIAKTPQGRPAFPDIRSHLQQHFKLQQDFLISALDGRHLIIRFKNEEDYYKVLLKDTILVHGRIFKFCKWTMDFSPTKDSPLVPVWLHLPSLPANFYCEPMIRSIAGTIGPVLQVDQNTSKMIRADAAVACVQLDVSKKLPDRVWVGVGAGGAWQPILYPAPPLFCATCSRLGHATNNCRSSAPEKEALAHGTQEETRSAPAAIDQVPRHRWAPKQSFIAVAPPAAAAPACNPHATSPSTVLPPVQAVQGNPDPLGANPVVYGNASNIFALNQDPRKETQVLLSPAASDLVACTEVSLLAPRVELPPHFTVDVPSIEGAMQSPSQLKETQPPRSTAGGGVHIPVDLPPSDPALQPVVKETPPGKNLVVSGKDAKGGVSTMDSGKITQPARVPAGISHGDSLGMLGQMDPSKVMGPSQQDTMEGVEPNVETAKELLKLQHHTGDLPGAESVTEYSTTVQTGHDVQTPLTFAQVVRQSPKSPIVSEKLNLGECSNTCSSGSSSGRRKTISRPSRKGGVRICLPIVRDRSSSPVRQLEEINVPDLSLQNNIKDWTEKISSVSELARVENIFMPDFRFDSEISGMDSEDDYMERCSRRPRLRPRAVLRRTHSWDRTSLEF